jgi:hypothetical protein
MGFGARGAILVGAGEKEAAAYSFLEGIDVLGRLFLGNPDPFLQLMKSLISAYRDVCDAGGIEPELGVLAPILDVFLLDRSLYCQ